MRFTIVAIAGDNGETNTIGTFSSRTLAETQASKWQGAHNPHHDPDLTNYAVCRIMTVQEWDQP